MEDMEKARERLADAERALANLEKLIRFRKQHLRLMEEEYTRKLADFEVTLSTSFARSRRKKHSFLEANHFKLLIRILQRNVVHLTQRRARLLQEVEDLRRACPESASAA